MDMSIAGTSQPEQSVGARQQMQSATKISLSDAGAKSGLVYLEVAHDAEVDIDLFALAAAMNRGGDHAQALGAKRLCVKGDDQVFRAMDLIADQIRLQGKAPAFSGLSRFVSGEHGQ